MHKVVNVEDVEHEEKSVELSRSVSFYFFSDRGVADTQSQVVQDATSFRAKQAGSEFLPYFG